MSTLIGFVTFGNLPFSKITYNTIKSSTEHPIDFCIVVGKPGDYATIEWANSEGIPCIVHDYNKGFPASLNDLYDYAWKTHSYDNLIITGNDIAVYPYCIDSMISLAEEGKYHVISALQYDVKELCTDVPETRCYFSGPTYIFSDFNSKPWEMQTLGSKEHVIADMRLYDIQNCCLYTKTYFDTVGYVDVNFFPAYYCDNDLARRIVNSGIACCSLVNARFFHFWSRTIHQETGGSNSKFFENNRSYYITKWGGDFGRERFSIPFNGGSGVTMDYGINIQSRDYEAAAISHWSR